VRAVGPHRNSLRVAAPVDARDDRQGRGVEDVDGFGGRVGGVEQRPARQLGGRGANAGSAAFWEPGAAAAVPVQPIPRASEIQSLTLEAAWETGWLASVLEPAPSRGQTPTRTSG